MGYTETDGTTIQLSKLVQFTQRQQEAQEALTRYRYVLYGGARGGGKSYWLRWQLLLLLMHWYYDYGLRNVRVGLFCSTYPELRDRQISRISAEFPPELGEIKNTQTDGLCFFLRPECGGGMIALRNLDDPSKFRSSEFAAIAVDELTLIRDKAIFDTLRGSLRWVGVKHTLFMAATNPDGVGNLWVRQLWIEKQFPPEMAGIADQFTFIQSLPSDNPHLDASYWADLRSQPPDVQRAWVEGDWYVFQGQAVPFRRDRHVVRPFEIPDYWIRKSGYDWGYSKPMAYLWGAINPDNGRVVVYRELYETGLSDPRQAELVAQMEQPGERVRVRFADPSVWTKRSLTDVATSTADVFAARGIYLTPANNDRINGKRKLCGLLEPLVDGQPGLMVFENCQNIIRTLPSLVYSQTNPEDVDTDGEDHAYDALRYMLTDRRDGERREDQRKRVEDNPWARLRRI